MTYALTLVTPPVIEPITLSETKSYLRVDTTADDVLITSLIIAARQMAELWLGRALITQTWRLQQDAVPEGAVIELPKPPLLSIVHIKTYDAADLATVFPITSYMVDLAHQSGRVVLRAGAVWPQVVRPANGFEVQFTAGYGAAASAIPANIRQGMLMHVASLYTARGDATSAESTLLPAAVCALYAPSRVLRVVG